MVIIRLARFGTKKIPYYKITVAEQKFKPNGKFIEVIGNYEPFKKKIKIDKKKLEHFIKNGAQMSKTVKNLMKKLENENTENN